MRENQLGGPMAEFDAIRFTTVPVLLRNGGQRV